VVEEWNVVGEVFCRFSQYIENGIERGDAFGKTD
jgi:hypothetical protein